MVFKVVYHRKIKKDLKKLEGHIVNQFFNIINGKLSRNPHQGIKLKGRYKNLWKYRLGDFRIIYSILDKELKIHILRMGHRSNIYDNIYY